MDIDKIAVKVIHYSFTALFFIVPLIFLPGHVELFQFNKMVTVYLFTIIIASAWLIRMAVAGRPFIRKTPFDLPIIFFFLSQLISTLTSIEPYTSFWGYYSRFHGGLFSTLSYLTLYYAFVSNLDANQTKDGKTPFHNRLVFLSVISTLLSVFIVSLYGILEHYGIDAHYWVQDVRNRVFSTIGQPNWLAALLVITTPLLFHFIFNPPQLKPNLKQLARPALFLAAALFYLALLYTKSRSGLLGFSLMYLLFWIPLFFFGNSRRLLTIFAKLTLVFALLSFLIGTPFTKSLKEIIQVKKPLPSTPPTATANFIPSQPPGGTESGEIRKHVWKGAFSVWKHWPVFGSGVETFAYSFYNFRPAEHNLVSEWDFLYNKAHNEYLNYLANTGLVGLAAFLFLQVFYLGWTIRAVLRKPIGLPTQSFLLALASGYSGLLVVNFFGFSTVSDGLLFFLFPAFACAEGLQNPRFFGRPPDPEKPAKNYTSGQIILILVLLLFAIYPLTKISKRWYADRLFDKGVKLSKANRVSEGVLLEQKASNLVPAEPLFHDSLSLDFARSAAALYAAESTESALLLANAALAHSDLTITQNPVHLNFLKNRFKVLVYLSAIDPVYRELSYQTLLDSHKLSPADPKISLNLALYYWQENDPEKAIAEFAETLRLKPDYTDARLLLGQFYEGEKLPDLAREQYQYVIEKIDPNNAQANQALLKLQN